ncbi:glycoside hydrolase family 2 protein [Bogoriella caseilytica]|uniref:Glycosyl hydrolase family 2 n=1 Tax=Bogoriella caseilytica TaxID=56055 RepID=A0A3N2BEJ7_9MICO|nr:glycoside hydrolase family 2 TIM barrel-domain containing protein [Bogoriella caseilytica]ROR73678.1 glycosyl hydrolase family 2 [Bogoriella caseilytica]
MITASSQDGTYPRPQLVRGAHLSLDRRCGFAYDDDDRGRAEGWHRRTEVFDRSIQLPFAPESAESGIGETGYHPVVWYRIPVSTGDLQEAGWDEQGTRLLLHFGAVDYRAEVWVDGLHVGVHEGGQTAFSVDITEALAEGAGEHVIVVRAEDDPLDATLPRGKQDWKEEPHGIWYYRTTGIWRTVWLEAVPQLHVTSLAWTPDLAQYSVRMELELSHRHPGAEVDVALSYRGEPLARLQVPSEQQTVIADIPINSLRNGQLQHEYSWSPEHPRLIDAAVTVRGDGEASDVVASYLGLRSVGTAHGRFLLNEHPVYLRSVLEQGYWPGSHFTAPSPAALREEAELIRDLGFNALRIHQKVEDPRFLYWCDRLGLLVWGETAGAYEFNALAVQRLTTEWVEIVRQYRSHPSIVTWVPFNESWGIQHGSHDPAQRAYAVGLTNLTRALDPSRPVISNDGWEHTDSDVWTIHDYEADGEVLRKRYGSRETLAEMIRGIGPAGRRLWLGAQDAPALQSLGSDEPIMLTEFGGVSFVTSEVPEDSWGYSTASDAADFEARLGAILQAVHASEHLSGFCYTQLTDTHQETNGLCDAQRRPKLPIETLAGLVRGAR